MNSIICLFGERKDTVTRLNYQYGSPLPGIDAGGTIDWGADVKDDLAAVSLTSPFAVSIVDLRKRALMQVIHVSEEEPVGWTSLSDNHRVVACSSQEGWKECHSAMFMS
jgi:hypothetical protein